ncbi:hypothetical protein, partial [Halorussus litoreus]|uniref:hypothetical protein n=1 Tax=Halorussus litoreus TaxID=1710536 RepID=UPI0018E50596
ERGVDAALASTTLANVAFAFVALGRTPIALHEAVADHDLIDVFGVENGQRGLDARDGRQLDYRAGGRERAFEFSTGRVVRGEVENA